MTRTLLLDDHLLLRVLVGDEPAVLRRRSTALATTGLWYHRLCRALADDTVIGVLSRSLGGLDAAAAAGVVRAVVELPEQIEVVSLRTLGWPMAELVVGGARLNLLALEALAAALHLDATICLAAPNANVPLEEAAATAGLGVRTIA